MFSRQISGMLATSFIPKLTKLTRSRYQPHIRNSLIKNPYRIHPTPPLRHAREHARRPAARPTSHCVEGRAAVVWPAVWPRHARVQPNVPEQNFSMRSTRKGEPQDHTLRSARLSFRLPLGSTRRVQPEKKKPEPRRAYTTRCRKSPLEDVSGCTELRARKRCARL